MGDSRRFAVVADFVLTRYPPARFPRVADVAGGMGMLAVHLAERGYAPEIIDPKPSNFPGRERKRGNALGIPRHRRVLLDSDTDRFDLFVGLHPDGATEALAEVAVTHPAVVIPCCTKGWSRPVAGEAADLVRGTWRASCRCWDEATLPMGGKAQALCTGGGAE
jgi:hypothetical protein